MIKKALTVSIVIPAYNEESYLSACLDAVKKQTVKPDEVIVVNNNSTDRTAEIARRYKFVTLLQEKKQGVTFARDRGFNAVKADIIGRIDADTILPPDWAATVIRLMTEKPQLAAVSGPTGFYDLPGSKTTLWLTKVIRTSLFYAGKRDSRYLFGSNMAVRRISWQTVAKQLCHKKGLHEDNDLAIHLDRQGLEVGYSNALVTDISVRRADVAPRAAWGYAFSEYKTYREHHICSIRALSAGLILLLVYPGLKWMHRAYDQKNKRFSWAHFRRPLVGRPHPQP
jgi:glycosyltransferase involved in cell wall biosynthesis